MVKNKSFEGELQEVDKLIKRGKEEYLKVEWDYEYGGPYYKLKEGFGKWLLKTLRLVEQLPEPYKSERGLQLIKICIKREQEEGIFAHEGTPLLSIYIFARLNFSQLNPSQRNMLKEIMKASFRKLLKHWKDDEDVIKLAEETLKFYDKNANNFIEKTKRDYGFPKTRE